MYSEILQPCLPAGYFDTVFCWGLFGKIQPSFGTSSQLGSWPSGAMLLLKKTSAALWPYKGPAGPHFLW
jgi:hypothetical protein